MRASFLLRIRFVAVLFVGIALVIITKLYLLQIVHGEEYRDRAENQHIAPTAHQFSRGAIYFTGKDGTLFSAAALKSGYTIALIPRQIENPERAFELLTELEVPIDRNSFDAMVAKTTDPYEEVMRRADETLGVRISEAAIPGVKAYRERWRYYPGNELGAHAIGFLGYGVGDILLGQYGLERSYDDALVRPDSGFNVNILADLFTNVGARLTGEARAGADLVTSIEPAVQAALEEELRAYTKHWSAKTVGGIVLEPSTGKIIALAALPVFDPNDIRAARPEALANPLSERVYEFGSTMKPLTVAAALDAKVIQPTDTYTDTGTIVIDTKRISNFDGKARGVVSMQEVLSQSLNVGIAHIVQKMGADTLRSYFTKFGLLEETGIDLPSEASPLIKNLESPRTVEYVTAGFGQGIAVTPIAMARALSALANHGTVPQLHVGVELRYPGGISHEIGWAPERPALSPEAAHATTRMLVEVVDTALLGGAHRQEELSIAAKTGTAQMASPNGGYYDDRYLHSFFGYFPAYEPRFLVFLFSVEPVGARYASETLTDPFFSMTKFLVTYYGIPPDRAPQSAPLP